MMVFHTLQKLNSTSEFWTRYSQQQDPRQELYRDQVAGFTPIAADVVQLVFHMGAAGPWGSFLLWIRTNPWNVLYLHKVLEI